jgi:hypothetical protein
MSASCVVQVVINPLRKFMSEFGIALPMAAARRYSLSPLGVGNHPKAITHTFATPLVDIGALFGPASPDRDESDRAPMAAVTRYGYVAITGLPTDSLVDAATRRVLPHLLIAPEAEDWRRRRQAEDAGRHNVYRGWFTLQDEHSFGISIGPDVAHGAETVDPADPLRAATPLPPDSLLPGWCAAVREYYRGMERTGAALMGGIARGLGLPETAVLPAFADGISTLRLMRYPLRPASAGRHTGGPALRRPRRRAAHGDPRPARRLGHRRPARAGRCRGAANPHAGRRMGRRAAGRGHADRHTFPLTCHASSCSGPSAMPSMSRRSTSLKR